MPQVELDNDVIDILNRIVLREKYETPSDAIRHLNNLSNLQGAVIRNQDKEIDELKKENDT